MLNFLAGAVLGEGAAVDVSATLLTQFGTIINGLISFVGSLLPVVLPLMAAVVTVTAGIKIFNKMRTKTGA